MPCQQRIKAPCQQVASLDMNGGEPTAHGHCMGWVNPKGCVAAVTSTTHPCRGQYFFGSAPGVAGFIMASSFFMPSFFIMAEQVASFFIMASSLFMPSFFAIAM